MKSVDVIYVDFQKEFDKVPHARLLFKLQQIGIRGNVINWVKNWLSDRSHRVMCSGVLSD